MGNQEYIIEGPRKPLTFAPALLPRLSGKGPDMSASSEKFRSGETANPRHRTLASATLYGSLRATGVEERRGSTRSGGGGGVLQRLFLPWNESLAGLQVSHSASPNP